MPGHMLAKHLPFGTNFKTLHENCKTIADIGSGGDPYEYATILIDKHVWVVSVESETLTFTLNRYVPFADGYFDRLFASKTQEGNDFKHVFWQNYDRFINCYYWQNDFKWEIKT